MNRPWMVLALTMALALAGCAEQQTDDPTPPAGDDTDTPTGDEPVEYQLTTSGVPATVAAGEEFNFTLEIEGPAGTSDHIGAHYGNTTSDEPSTAVYDKACDHTEGALPGTFTVTCTIPEDGTWYLRGHLRVGAGDAARNWWGPENTIVVSPAVEASVATAVEVVSVGEVTNGTSTVCWTVSGTGTSNHVAVHWDNETHADDENVTFAAYDAGLSYPDNMTGADPEGYELTPTGTRFCTDIPVGDETVYFVAHAMDSRGPPGILSAERTIEPAAA